MMQIIAHSHDEKVAMYMKLSKKELAEMLVTLNNFMQVKFQSGVEYTKIGEVTWIGPTSPNQSNVN